MNTTLLIMANGIVSRFGGYLVRGTELKDEEIVSYDCFQHKSEFINENNGFSLVGVEWICAVDWYRSLK